MNSPWFYSRSFLNDNARFIKGEVIDIGCGSAKYKSLILDFPAVKNYTGLDFFRGEAADIVADLNKKLPIENNKYDSALCISVLEHLLEPQFALDEIYRILKPGGHLLLATPWIYPFHGEPHDYFRYSRFALKYMLEKSGFKIILIQPTGGKGRIFLVFFQRWFPFLGKIIRIAEKFVPASAADNSKLLNTPSYQVIAQK